MGRWDRRGCREGENFDVNLVELLQNLPPC